MQQRVAAAILARVLIVSRYLLREFLLASGAVLLAIVVTWIAADTLLHLDELEGGVSAWLAGLDRMLDVVPLGVPMSCAVGVVWSITRAVRSREITAIRCGGIPLRSALLPIVAASRPAPRCALLHYAGCSTRIGRCDRCSPNHAHRRSIAAGNS